MKVFAIVISICLCVMAGLVALSAFWFVTLDRSVQTSRVEFTQYSNDLGMQSRSIALLSSDVTPDGETSEEASDVPAETTIDLTTADPVTRPDWVDAPPVLTGDVHRWAVVSTPASTAELSRRGLDAQLRAVAETYIETHLNDPDAISVISIDDAWVRDHVSADRQYEGKVSVDGEEMYESAAELLFEPADRQWIDSQWKAHLIGQRLAVAGILIVIIGMFLFAVTAVVSMIVRRAEQRVTQGLPS
jgi:hypothetical protein